MPPGRPRPRQVKPSSPPRHPDPAFDLGRPGVAAAQRRGAEALGDFGPSWRREPAQRCQVGAWRRSLWRRWAARTSSTRSLTSAPSRTTARPATTVWRAATGPHRSHASTGSVMAPANGQPLERPAHQVAGRTDRRARRARPSRPRHAGPPAGGDLQRVAGPRGRRALAAGARAAWRCGPPSTARPSRSTRSRRTPARPAPPRPGARPPGRCRRRRSSCWSSGSGRRPRRPRPSRAISAVVRIDAVRHPRAIAAPADGLEVLDRCGCRSSRRRSVSSSASSARWVWSRTSSRSASSAVRTISSRRDRERRARRQRDAHHRAAAGVVVELHQSLASRPGSCRRPARPSRVAGRRPSATGVIEPRVGWKRMPSSRGRRDLGRDEVAAARGVDVQVVGASWCTRRGPARPARPRPTGRRPPRRGGSTAGRAW